eukprot:TRINITY_DN22905_c0_g1_i4.p1 TRINITY_DN22905_c0_g1~~TRINITY_DN22905_c0_g1_i4.p1  ORF type:complete len:1039 (+),score=272.20 TRINITY_DN22905_c0_g1_i4:36-3152(+)
MKSIFFPGDIGKLLIGCPIESLPIAAGFFIKNFGEIGFPLHPLLISHLKSTYHNEKLKSEPCEIPSKDLEMANPAWNAALNDLFNYKVLPFLTFPGGDQPHYVLHKALIYEPGNVFNKSQLFDPTDSSTFGILLVQLPSRFTGGQLQVQYSDEEGSYDFGETDSAPYTMHYVSTFTEVEVNIANIRTGSRVMLVYHIRIAPNSRYPSKLKAPYLLSDILSKGHHPQGYHLVLEGDYGKDTHLNDLVGLDKRYLDIIRRANSLLPEEKKLEICVVRVKKLVESSKGDHHHYYRHYNSSDEESDWECDKEEILLKEWSFEDNRTFTLGQFMDLHLEKALNTSPDVWGDAYYADDDDDTKTEKWQRHLLVFWLKSEEYSFYFSHIPPQHLSSVIHVFLDSNYPPEKLQQVKQTLQPFFQSYINNIVSMDKALQEKEFIDHIAICLNFDFLEPALDLIRISISNVNFSDNILNQLSTMIQKREWKMIENQLRQCFAVVPFHGKAFHEYCRFAITIARDIPQSREFLNEIGTKRLSSSFNLRDIVFLKDAFVLLSWTNNIDSSMQPLLQNICFHLNTNIIIEVIQEACLYKLTLDNPYLYLLVKYRISWLQNIIKLGKPIKNWSVPTVSFYEYPQIEQWMKAPYETMTIKGFTSIKDARNVESELRVLPHISTRLSGKGQASTIIVSKNANYFEKISSEYENLGFELKEWNELFEAKTIFNEFDLPIKMSPVGEIVHYLREKHKDNISSYFSQTAVEVTPPQPNGKAYGLIVEVSSNQTTNQRIQHFTLTRPSHSAPLEIPSNQNDNITLKRKHNPSGIEQNIQQNAIYPNKLQSNIPPNKEHTIPLNHQQNTIPFNHPQNTISNPQQNNVPPNHKPIPQNTIPHQQNIIPHQNIIPNQQNIFPPQNILPNQQNIFPPQNILPNQQNIFHNQNPPTWGRHLTPTPPFSVLNPPQHSMMSQPGMYQVPQFVPMQNQLRPLPPQLPPLMQFTNPLAAQNQPTFPNPQQLTNQQGTNQQVATNQVQSNTSQDDDPQRKKRKILIVD